jgi:hypothetical protein
MVEEQLASGIRMSDVSRDDMPIPIGVRKFALRKVKLVQFIRSIASIYRSDIYRLGE